MNSSIFSIVLFIAFLSLTTSLRSPPLSKSSTPKIYTIPPPTTLFHDSFNCNPFGIQINPRWLQGTASPETSEQTNTSFQWDNYSTERLVVEVVVCDYAAIRGIKFGTSNVKMSGIHVNRNSLNDAEFDKKTKMVRLDVRERSNRPRMGGRVRISVTSLDPSLPVSITNLTIHKCNYNYHCFLSCAVFHQDKETGCYLPGCHVEPCNGNCEENEECRLIERDLDSFAMRESASPQLWSCVDKGNTTFGCLPVPKKTNRYGCPVC